MTVTESTTGLRAIHLQASNIKRLRAIDVELAPGLQVISGRNGQGKSSTLDALFYAIGGGKAQAATPEVLRRGERKATVKVTLGGDTPELIVTRTWNADGGNGTLTVTTPDGAKYPQAQTTLNDLVGALSFDPLAFMAASAKSQREQVLRIAPLPFDVDALEAERQRLYETRTERRRDLKRLEAVVESLPVPTAGVPDVEVSTADLLAEHRAATNSHAVAASTVDRIDGIDERTAALQAELAALAAERQQLVASYEAMGPLPDLAAIEARMASVDDTNRRVREAAARRNAETQAAAAAKVVEDLDGQIAAIDRRKADGLAAAAMPIDGLGVDADGVTYRGLPLTQASGAEQLRVSLAIAMAANPTLRLMLIRDGSLLDTDGLATVGRMADENGYQVLVERVAGSGGPVGIVIEDGLVAETEAGEVVEPTAEAAALVEAEVASPGVAADFGWLDGGDAA